MDGSTKQTIFYKRYVSLCLKEEKPNSPSAIAIKLGFSNSTATTWKKGKVPSDPSIQKIADYFNVPFEWLKGETENPSADQNSIENLTDRTIGNLSSPEDAGELLEALIPFIPKNELLRLAQMLMEEYQKRDQG